MPFDSTQAQTHEWSTLLTAISESLERSRPRYLQRVAAAKYLNPSIATYARKSRVSSADH